MLSFTLDQVEHWLREHGRGLYGGECVTQLEHALQCAALAQAEDAAPELIVAALLHDIAHLAPDTDDRRQPHEKLGSTLLAHLFPPSVTEPIRLHVDAKRYLCAADLFYWQGLSEMSQRSLEWQGGPFAPLQAVEFIAQSYAEDAVRLRRWDDAAKEIGRSTPSLDHYLVLMRACASVPA